MIWSNEFITAIKRKQTICFVREQGNILYLFKENKDLFVNEDSFPFESLLGFYKSNFSEISQENISKLESSTRMHISSINTRILRDYALKILDWEWTIKEIYSNSLSNLDEYIGIAMILVSIQKWSLFIQDDSIEVTKVDRELGFKKLRILAGPGILKINVKNDLTI